ncbi:UNVERIFIED_CONTAM: hypothetical protein K2H54_052128 [Gekko kuhli]
MGREPHHLAPVVDSLSETQDKQEGSMAPPLAQQEEKPPAPAISAQKGTSSVGQARPQGRVPWRDRGAGGTREEQGGSAQPQGNPKNGASLTANPTKSRLGFQELKYLRYQDHLPCMVTRRHGYWRAPAGEQQGHVTMGCSITHEAVVSELLLSH